MYRGRLEIYDPDGPVSTFFLDKEVVAIGRSVGNDLVLDRHGISRYHAKLTAKDQQAIIEDLESVNGTYVDGIRLKANDPRALRGGEEIQIGDIRLIFQPPEEEDTTAQTITQRIELGTLQVELDGPDIAITPGTHAPATLKIHNRGTAAQRISVKIEGVPKEWVRVDRTEFDIDPDEQTQVGLNFKPQRRPETQPGEYTVKIAVTPQQGLPIEMTTRLQILQYSGYGAVIGTPFVTDKQPFKMYIHNQGNGPLNLRFWGVTHGLPLQFDLQPASIMLGPGERQTIGGQIRLARAAWFGKPQVFSYDLISQSLDAAAFQAPLSGQFQTTPLLPAWAPITALGGILIIGVLLAVFIFGLLGDAENDNNQPPASPTITSFEISSHRITLNAPLLVSWTTEQARSVQVVIRRGGMPDTMQSLPDVYGDNYPISLAIAGRYEVILVAENQRNEVQESRLVLVQPQIILAIRPLPNNPALYRNLAGQQLEVTWEVQWIAQNAQNTANIPAPAVYLKIPQLNINQLETTGPTSRTFDIPVLTTLDPLTVTLQINTSDDVQTEDMETVNVVYPECTTTTSATLAQVDVYRGPSPQYPLMGAIEPSTTVHIEARNSTSSWLWILVPPPYRQAGLSGWVRIENLSCAGFAVQQLVTIANEALPPLPATPTPTTMPTPVASPTPQPTATSSPVPDGDG